MGLSTGEFLVDDVRLAYRTNGSGALLLILPGNTALSAYHTGELEHFGERFHAVSPDFRGTAWAKFAARCS
jgi:hypothetical protein